MGHQKSYQEYRLLLQSSPYAATIGNAFKDACGGDSQSSNRNRFLFLMKNKFADGYILSGIVMAESLGAAHYKVATAEFFGVKTGNYMRK